MIMIDGSVGQAAYDVALGAAGYQVFRLVGLVTSRVMRAFARSKENAKRLAELDRKEQEAWERKYLRKKRKRSKRA